MDMNEAIHHHVNERTSTPQQAQMFHRNNTDFSFLQLCLRSPCEYGSLCRNVHKDREERKLKTVVARATTQVMFATLGNRGWQNGSRGGGNQQNSNSRGRNRSRNYSPSDFNTEDERDLARLLSRMYQDRRTPRGQF